MATQSAGHTFYPVIFLVYAVALGYDWIYLEIGHEGYGGKFKYLTFWNLVSMYLHREAKQCAFHFTEDTISIMQWRKTYTHTHTHTHKTHDEHMLVGGKGAGYYTNKGSPYAVKLRLIVFCRE